MPAITFDVPEKIAEQIALMPEDERNEWAAEVLQYALNEDGTSDAALTEADHESIRRGLADAGRVADSDTFFARLFEKVGLPAPPPFAEAVEEKRREIKVARNAYQSPK